MYRTSDVIKPKTKIAVELRRTDGSVLEGHVYVAGSERILDVLNSAAPFFPIEVQSGKVLLVNKNSINIVEPFDEDWMEGELIAQTTFQPGGRQ